MDLKSPPKVSPKVKMKCCRSKNKLPWLAIVLAICQAWPAHAQDDPKVRPDLRPGAAGANRPAKSNGAATPAETVPPNPGPAQPPTPRPSATAPPNSAAIQEPTPGSTNAMPANPSVKQGAVATRPAKADAKGAPGARQSNPDLVT